MLRFVGPRVLIGCLDEDLARSEEGSEDEEEEEEKWWWWLQNILQMHWKIGSDQKLNMPILYLGLSL
jgi:hypothetical protein